MYLPSGYVMTLIATRLDAAARLKLRLGEKGKEVHLEYNMTATVRVDNSRGQGDIFVKRNPCVASPQSQPERRKLLSAVNKPLVEDAKQYGFPDLDTQVPITLLIKICPKEGRQLSARSIRYPLFAALQDWIHRATDTRQTEMAQVCRFLKQTLATAHERRAAARQMNQSHEVPEGTWTTFLNGAMDRASLEALSTSQTKGSSSTQRGGATGRAASQTRDAWRQRPWHEGGPAKRSKGTSGSYGAHQRWSSDAKRQKGGASGSSARAWQ